MEAERERERKYSLLEFSRVFIFVTVSTSFLKHWYRLSPEKESEGQRLYIFIIYDSLSLTSYRQG